MRPRRLTLAEAVDEVRDGDCVYLGNFGAQLFCVADRLVAAGRRGLHVVVASGGLLLDRLIGAGVVARATFAHCWSPVGPDPAWHFRRAVETGDPPVARHEVSLGMLSAALTAGAWGVPFLPVPAPQGTGYLTEDWPDGLLAVARCEFGEAYVVRALVPDVAFVHVDLVDEWGNGVIRGPVGEALVAAQAARRTVLVAEEVADHARVRAAGIRIPGLVVDAVVHHPGAVRPDGAAGRYHRDVDAYRALVREAAAAVGRGAP